MIWGRKKQQQKTKNSCLRFLQMKTGTALKRLLKTHLRSLGVDSTHEQGAELYRVTFKGQPLSKVPYSCSLVPTVTPDNSLSFPHSVGYFCGSLRLVSLRSLSGLL